MNEFVTYLNSINNVGGNSTGSLAESQVKSEFFDKVKVDRQLGNYIAEGVLGTKYNAFILTGHAGDGKTSILVQVLKRLGYLNDEGLKIEGSFPNFYYIKDMSEIAEERQVQVLKTALSAPEMGKSSLLISNTGPLLNAFTALIKEESLKQGKEFSESAQIELQSTLLSQLDLNVDKPVQIAGFSFYLINIARVDNVSFSTRILKKIVDDDLWGDCASCSNKDRCPIFNNKRLVSRQFDRVAAFVENYYRFLFENDKRMTIRQMVGQLSYALTGNLSCLDIAQKYLKEPFFNYNFANLFFGYYGIDKKKDSSQIKGIEQIQILELDGIALDVDYRLFVNHELSFFTPEIQIELQGLHSKYRKHYQIASEDEQISPEEQKVESKLRRAVRRFYLMYSLYSEKEELDNIFNQIFGTTYSSYCKLISSKQPKQMLRNLQTTIFRALYMKNTGAAPEGESELPLTLRREDDVFQNVMLVLGEVNKSNLEIQQRDVENAFEDSNAKQEIYLKLKDDLFKLTFPMVNYFQNLIDGAIASNSNPALSHGIATLDAMLLKNFGDEMPENEEDCELRVIINTTSGQEFETFSFSDNRLNVW